MCLVFSGSAAMWPISAQVGDNKVARILRYCVNTIIAPAGKSL